MEAPDDAAGRPSRSNTAVHSTQQQQPQRSLQQVVHQPSMRHERLLTRVLVRTGLARGLEDTYGTAAASSSHDLQFVRNQHGKPYLAASASQMSPDTSSQPRPGHSLQRSGHEQQGHAATWDPDLGHTLLPGLHQPALQFNLTHTPGLVGEYLRRDCGTVPSLSCMKCCFLCALCTFDWPFVCPCLSQCACCDNLDT